MGAGEGIDNDRVRTLMVPSEKGTCFGLVGLTGSFSIGPANAGNAVMRRFLDALGKATPVTVGLFPIHYGGRIVFGIYMDNGDGAVAGTDISDILIVAQRASAALTRLVRSRQAAG
jgi:hypothetical protein